MTQSNEPTIEQKNQAIAEFLGWEFKQEGEDWYMAYHEGRAMWADNKKGLNRILLEGFKFHEDWNKLMPVVENIETPELNVRGRGIIRAAADVEILYKACVITYEPDEESGDTNDAHGVAESGETKLEAVYKAVYQFIQWFNQQSTSRLEKLFAEADQACKNIKETFNKMAGRKICSNCGIDYDEKETHICS